MGNQTRTSWYVWNARQTLFLLGHHTCTWKAPKPLPPNANQAIHDAYNPVLGDTLDAAAILDKLLAEEEKKDCARPPTTVPAIQSWNNSDAIEELLENPPISTRITDLLDEQAAIRTRKDLQREGGFPSFATFVRALKAPQFDNVKKRPKHFHCRCPTHVRLQTNIHRACFDPVARMEHERELREHHSKSGNGAPWSSSTRWKPRMVAW